MGHLRQLAALFTDRPVSLAITHGSVDHAGAGLAPKDFKAVYMNPLDDDRLVNFGKSPFRRFTNDVNESRPTAKVDYYDILSVADYLIWTPDVKYTPMKDGMTFDLGNSTIEAIWVPGHSPGCTSFLLKESRTLISGDCAGISTQVNVGTIEDYRKSVLKLIARRADFDRIFISHGPQIPQGTPAPLDLFDKILATCDALLKGTLRGVPVPPSTDKIYGGTSAYVATSMVLGREQSYGNIRYNPELVLNAQQ
jgi:glyoxylase-like metal-dependent hydrolase (beta-lactamase superfamily II)